MSVNSLTVERAQEVVSEFLKPKGLIINKDMFTEAFRMMFDTWVDDEDPETAIVDCYCEVMSDCEHEDYDVELEEYGDYHPDYGHVYTEDAVYCKYCGAVGRFYEEMTEDGPSGEVEWLD